MLYEMLAGRRAVRGDTVVETLNAILKQEPEELGPELKVPPSRPAWRAQGMAACPRRRRGRSGVDLRYAYTRVQART